MEILKILSEKFKGHITQEECTEILRYIYNDEDYKEIIAKVEENLQIVENKIGQG